MSELNESKQLDHGKALSLKVYLIWLLLTFIFGLCEGLNMLRSATSHIVSVIKFPSGTVWKPLLF